MSRKPFEVRWRGIDGVARKYSFEPMHGEYLRIEYEWTGDHWREVGREPAEDVACEVESGVLIP
mgnify:CR=1 FL=1